MFLAAQRAAWVNLPGYCAGSGVPCVSLGQAVWSQAVVEWRISYSTGVSMLSDECRLGRLWKISRYSKTACCGEGHRPSLGDVERRWSALR